jgi:hypothetical protein
MADFKLEVNLPAIKREDVQLARELLAESSDAKVKQVCQVLIGLEPQLADAHRAMQEAMRRIAAAVSQGKPVSIGEFKHDPQA